MNNITKYNLKTTLISVAGLILLYSALAFLIAPQSGFVWSSINPLEFLKGVVFALGFGLGFPVWVSIIVIGLVSFLLFVVFLWVARKVVK